MVILPCLLSALLYHHPPNQEDPKDDDKAVQTGDTAGSPIVPIAGLALAAGAVMAAVRKKED